MDRWEPHMSFLYDKDNYGFPTKQCVSLYVFFWVFLRRQIVICRRFGTLCQFHLQRLGVEYWQRVPKRRQITIWRRRNTQKNTYNIQNTAKVWNQEYERSASMGEWFRSIRGTSGNTHSVKSWKTRILYYTAVRTSNLQRKIYIPNLNATLHTPLRFSIMILASLIFVTTKVRS
jgi:hypothetical protein